MEYGVLTPTVLFQKMLVCMRMLQNFNELMLIELLVLYRSKLSVKMKDEVFCAVYDECDCMQGLEMHDRLSP